MRALNTDNDSEGLGEDRGSGKGEPPGSDPAVTVDVSRDTISSVSSLLFSLWRRWRPRSASRLCSSLSARAASRA